jgi:tetratricopeptide (TPR) repeat protein
LAVLSAISISAAEIDKKAYEQNFNQAVLLFNKADYNGAYKIFNQLFEENPSDARVNFYLGRAALETKQYEEALMAFERVLIVEPTHIRSRMEMARAYFELKEFDSADLEFDKVLESDIPKKVRDQIMGYKSAIDAAKKKHFINGYIMAGIGWDSNINNGIGTKDYTIPALGASVPGEAPKSDYYHTQVFGLNHFWNLSGIKDGFFWQDGFTTYFQTYRQNIANNARYFGVTTGPGHRGKDYEISLVFGADKLIYGPSFPYMQTLSVSPKGSYKLSETLILEGSFTLKNKFYMYERGNRDSLYEELYMGFRKLVPSMGSMVSIGFTGGRDLKKRQPANTDVSNNIQKYSVSLYQPIIAGVDMTAGVSATKTSYTDTDMAFFRKESDFASNYSLGLIKTINKSSMLNLSTTYSNNKSNIENKVYSKKGASLSYVYNF